MRNPGPVQPPWSNSREQHEQNTHTQSDRPETPEGGAGEHSGGGDTKKPSSRAQPALMAIDEDGNDMMVRVACNVKDAVS